MRIDEESGKRIGIIKHSIAVILFFFKQKSVDSYRRMWHSLVHGQVTIIFVVSVCLSVCLFVQSFLSRL